MEKKNLKHFGIPGMHWGIRRQRSAANAARRDASSLKSHGYTKEAAALLKNAKKLDAGAEARVKAIREKKAREAKMWDGWTTGQRRTMKILAVIGAVSVVDAAIGTVASVAIKSALR